MTDLLEKAYVKATQLTESEQDVIASIILEELISEDIWNKKFSETQEILGKLGLEAENEYAAGKTRPLSFDF